MSKERREKLQGVRFVYFDVGNVFFSFSGGLEDLAVKFNQPLADIGSYWRSRDDEICRGELPPQDFWVQMKNHFSYSGEDIDFVDFWINHFEKIEKGHLLAKELSKNHQLGLITNAYPGVIQRILKTDLMPQVSWTDMVISSEVGFVKPERELFDIARQRTGLKPEEILLIDDIRENCKKAEELGWKSIVFQ